MPTVVSVFEQHGGHACAVTPPPASERLILLTGLDLNLAQTRINDDHEVVAGGVDLEGAFLCEEVDVGGHEVGELFLDQDEGDRGLGGGVERDEVGALGGGEDVVQAGLGALDGGGGELGGGHLALFEDLGGDGDCGDATITTGGFISVIAIPDLHEH